MEAADFLATAKLALRGANGVAHNHHGAGEHTLTGDGPTLSPNLVAGGGGDSAGADSQAMATDVQSKEPGLKLLYF